MFSAGCCCGPPPFIPCCPDSTLPETLHLTFDDSGTCDLIDGETFELTYNGSAWLTPEFGSCTYYENSVIPTFFAAGATAGFFFGCNGTSADCNAYYVAGHFGGTNQSWLGHLTSCSCDPPMWRFENAPVNFAFVISGVIQYRCCDCCKAVAQLQNCNIVPGFGIPSPIPPGFDFIGDTLYIPNCTVTA